MPEDIPSECTAEKLHARGSEHAPRLVDVTGCSLGENPWASEKTYPVVAIDAFSKEDLARLLHCPALPAIDWTRESVGVIAYHWGESPVAVRTGFDDGTFQTFVIELPAADSPRADKLAVVIVPRERSAAYIACR